MPLCAHLGQQSKHTAANYYDFFSNYYKFFQELWKFELLFKKYEFQDYIGAVFPSVYEAFLNSIQFYLLQYFTLGFW